MEFAKLAICSVLAQRLNKEVNPHDVEVESFWFEPDGYWRAVVLHNRGVVRIRGSVGELFGDNLSANVVDDEESADVDVEPGEDGRIELPITGKGYGIGAHYTTHTVHTNAGELAISEAHLSHTLGPAFREIFGDADVMEITFHNKHGIWAPKKD